MSKHSTIRVVLEILRLADQSLINHLTEGFALRLQTLNKLRVKVAERVPGPDTGPTSPATQAQRSHMELEGGCSIIKQDCRVQVTLLVI